MRAVFFSSFARRFAIVQMQFLNLALREFNIGCVTQETARHVSIMVHSVRSLNMSCLSGLPVRAPAVTRTGSRVAPLC